MLENASVIHFDLTNGGTGPAIIEWLRIKWDGRPTNGPRDLLDRCCRVQRQALPIWVNRASGQTLPAGRSEDIFQMRLRVQIPLYTVSLTPMRGSKSRPKVVTAPSSASAGLLTSRFGRESSRLANPL